MKKIELKEMQQIELNLLLEFDKVCKKNNLHYYMDGGTLLGAMCYEGFIPWDDDIDLKMPRRDYNRLLNLQNEFPEYIKIDKPTKEHCDYTMTKLIDDRTVLVEKQGEVEKKTGIYIDIFPMDGYPDEPKEYEAHLRKMQRLNSLFHLSLVDFQNYKESKSLLSSLKGAVYRIIYSPWKLYNKLESCAIKYDYDKAKYVGLLIEGSPEKEKFDKNWLEEGFTLEFEGYQIPAPSGYKRHLEIFYGDHITDEKYHHNLPYIKPDHNHEVYWKE